jgi:hypothetical protein
MEEFDYKKFLVENRLTPNSRLLNEATTTPESETWLLVNELIANYGFDGSFEDGIYTSPQGFKFKDMGDKIVAELQYGDYGSSREESEAALDPLVGELEDELNRIEFPYKITTTSRAYFIAIYPLNDDITQNTIDDSTNF